MAKHKDVSISEDKPGGLLQRLQFSEDIAHQVLSKYKGKRLPERMLDEAQKEINYAKGVLEECKLARKYYETNDTTNCSYHAYDVGSLTAHLRLMPRLPASKTGRKVREGGLKGQALATEYRTRRREEIQKKHSTWSELAKKINKSSSQRQIADSISRKTGDKSETIRKYLRQNSAK